MSADSPRHEIATRTVIYRATTDGVIVRRNVPYGAAADDRTFDVYYPAVRTDDALKPAVLFVTGYPDEGLRRVLGCIAKDMGSYVSWARLVAANGIIAIAYENRTPEDVHAVLRYVDDHAAALGVDTSRVGVWSCSGNVPTALALLMNRSRALACAVLCYGFMLDLDGAHHVADAARRIGFANPCEGRTVADLPVDLPLFLARAGRDETPGLNASLDTFVSHALALNRPVTVVNHHDGPHAFDILDDSDASRRIIRQILAFMRLHYRVDHIPPSRSAQDD